MTLDGAISWSSDNSPVCVLYHTTLATPPVNYGSAGYISYASYPDSGDGWHKVMADTDFYASYSYDGGQTWTASVKIVG